MFKKHLGIRLYSVTLKTVTCIAEEKKQGHLVKHRLDALLGWRVQLFVRQDGVGGQLGDLIPFDGLKNRVWFLHPGVNFTNIL